MPDTVPCILFVTNVEWFFLSHRLPLARAMQRQGARVVIAAADTGRVPEITAEGFEFVALPFSRRGINPLAELRTLVAIVALYRRLRPDLIHQISIKPVLYGSLAARLAGRPPLVNAISGLGHLFAEGNIPVIARRLVESVYRIALGGRRTRTVFQNPEDRDEFVRRGLVPLQRTVLVRGSGVDCAHFAARAEPPGDPIVMFAGRLLWEKGFGEFVEAARRVRQGGSAARFVLVGPADDDNPTAVTRAQIVPHVEAGVIEWWGPRRDMPEVLASSAIVVLPTFYKEGLPKVLLEAAAAGRPLVATDIPGCREIVRHGVNGFLIPTRDPAALTQRVEELLAAPALRQRFGAASRRIAVEEFSEGRVVSEIVGVYDELLSSP